ncbi:hypothetical protein L484_009229 [Morus notabilis]|uniref:Serine/threonine-protein kinase n=1 Tax=Morus notabilis TaxID=981085 RepID=W9RVB0_9ROSA|nr:receptor-like cytoplasmic kinase 176 [Morus notabilis]EXC11818.1 hypothetical protein L484_009229 [Morus notabilis]
MLSGQQAIDKNRPTGQHNLVDWAKPYLTNKCRFLHVLKASTLLVWTPKAANLALQCLAIDSKYRPNMDEVVTALEQLQDSKDIPKGAHNETCKSSRSSAANSSKSHYSYPWPSNSLLRFSLRRGHFF